MTCKPAITLFGIFVLLGMLTGCGGSSVDLPTKVFTNDVYAIQWVDFTELEPEDATAMLNDLADDMSDDQPKARLWMSAQADALQSSYTERWEAFTEAGGIGMLVIHTAKTEGEETKRLVREEFVLVHVKKDTSTDDLEKAMKDFAKDDGNEKIKFTKVDDTDGRWFWLTREDRSENAATLPSDGNEENTKAFTRMLKQADDAAVASAWRKTDAISEMIKQKLDKADDANLSDDDKQRLKEAYDIEQIVMSANGGSDASCSTTVEFANKELAQSFVEHHNDGLIDQRLRLKMNLVNSENPPHPSVIDRMFEQREVKSSGNKVSIGLDEDGIADVMNCFAATQGQGSRGLMSPGQMLPLHSDLHVPGAPGVPNCYRITMRDR